MVKPRSQIQKLASLNSATLELAPGIANPGADPFLFGDRHSVVRAMPHILVVDDDPIFGRLMRIVSKKENIPTTICKSPKELEKYLARPEAFDVAMIDYDLGNISGLQLSQHLNSCWHDLPIVMISEYSKIDTKTWPYTVVDFIHKSVGVQGLLAGGLEAYEYWKRTGR